MNIKLKNEYLIPAANFMQKLKLKGAESRARSKFVKLLTCAVEELEESRQALLKEHAELDDQGKMIERNGECVFKEGEKASYVNEYTKLLKETAEIQGGTYTEHLDKVKTLLGKCDIELDGTEAEIYDILLDALEEGK